MWFVGEALDELFSVYWKEDIRVFFLLLSKSRIRLCIYHPEVTEAHSPTDRCEFWIIPTMSQIWINRVIRYLKCSDADLNVSNFPLEALLALCLFTSYKWHDIWLWEEWIPASLQGQSQTAMGTQSFSALHPQQAVTLCQLLHQLCKVSSTLVFTQESI